MKKIRIGNTFEVRWSIFAGKGENAVPYDLTGKDLSVYLVTAFNTIKVDNYSTEDNIIMFTFEGKDQRHAGTYQMTLIENEGKDGMRTLDTRNGFELVKCSCVEDNAYDDIDIVSLSSELNALKIYPIIPEIGDNGNWFIEGKDTGKPSISYGGVVVDSALSAVSDNPVKNKVITKAIQNISPVIADFTVEEIYDHIVEKTEFQAQQGSGIVLCDAILNGKAFFIPYDDSQQGYAQATGGLESEILILRIALKEEIVTAHFNVNDFRDGRILALESTASNILNYSASTSPSANSVVLRDESGSVGANSITDKSGMIWATPTSDDDTRNNADHIFQEQLVNGRNIKTINDQNILGEGDLKLGAWSLNVIDQNSNDTIYLQNQVINFVSAGESTGQWVFDLARNKDASDVGKQWRLIIGTEEESGAEVILQMTDVIWENGEPELNGGYYDITFICPEAFVILAKYTQYNR